MNLRLGAWSELDLSIPAGLRGKDCLLPAGGTVTGPGLLTEVRWMSSDCDPKTVVFVFVCVDSRPGSNAPLPPDAKGTRFMIASNPGNGIVDLGAPFKQDGVYRLPLSNGIQFQREFTVVFSSRIAGVPPLPSTPSVRIDSIALAWWDEGFDLLPNPLEEKPKRFKKKRMR